MKYFTKFLSLALVLCLALCLFAGCNNAASEATSEATTEEHNHIAGVFVDGKEVKFDSVLTIDGREVSFDLYRYMYLYIRDMFDQGDATLWTGEEAAEATTALNNYVESQLAFIYAVDALAEKENISLTMDELANVDVSIEQAKESLGGEEAFIDALAHAYMTPDVYRMLCINETLRDKLIRTLYGEELAADIEKNYVHVKHILVKFANAAEFGADTAAEETTQTHDAELAKANDILAKIKAGDDFDALVKEHSEDAGQGETGYTFTYGKMTAPFEEAAFALPVGETSGLVETSYGYHIIKRLPLDKEYVDTNLLSLMSSEMNDTILNYFVEEMDAMEFVYVDNFDVITPETMV